MSPLPNVVIELIPDPEMGGYTAFIPDLPAIGEGETQEKAIADLKKGIQLYVDEFGMEEALSRVIALSDIRTVNLGELVHG